MPIRKGQKIKYPKDRRRPVKHWVTGHTRRGKRVKAFQRGSGSHPQKYQRSRVVGGVTDDDTPIGVHGFVVNFKFSDKPGDGESVLVMSDNFSDCLDEAYEEKIDPRSPIAVEIIDPDIGAMLEWTGKRVRSAIKYGKPKIKRATELGAKYAVKATMATGRTAKRVAKAGVGASAELFRLTAFAAQKEIIQSLLKLCYQRDKAKRIAARVALKKRYPDVYSMCSFSKETQRRPKKVPEVFHLPVRYRGV